MTCQVRCTSAVLGWYVGTVRPYWSETGWRDIRREGAIPTALSGWTQGTTARSTRNDLQLYRTRFGLSRYERGSEGEQVPRHVAARRQGRSSGQIVRQLLRQIVVRQSRARAGAASHPRGPP